MIGLGNLIRRNNKLFFKDAGMFVTSLITPAILLVLYATFLEKVYRDAFLSSIPEGVNMVESIINGLVGGQLVSSLLAVSCVTVAFCSNLLMVQDKVTGAVRDITMSSVKRSTLALSYFISSGFVTLIIALTALILGFGYLYIMGCYLSALDVVKIVGDVFLLILFGTALSSLINYPLKTNGQGSAVGTIISSCYGFICGAYMPISNFPEPLQRAISFLPGTYGTSLLRNHFTDGTFNEMLQKGIPSEVVDSIKKSIDCNIYFFDTKVEIPAMYLVLGGSILVILIAYILVNLIKNPANK